MRRNVLDKGLATGRINSISPTLIGAGIGAASGLFGGGGGGETSSTSMPAWMKEYYTGSDGALPAAQALFEAGGPDYYEGDMVADLDPLQMQSINQISNLAENDVLNPAGAGYAADVLAGDYLGGDQFMDAYGQDILEGVDSQFARGGRSGSGYNSKVATSELGNVASRLYGDERNRQNQILSQIPSLVESQYTPTEHLMDAGGMLQTQAQAETDADVRAFDYDQNKDRYNLETYMDFLNAVPAGSTTTTSGPRENPLIAGLGGAMSGASFGSNFAKPAATGGQENLYRQPMR